MNRGTLTHPKFDALADRLKRRVSGFLTAKGASARTADRIANVVWTVMLFGALFIMLPFLEFSRP